MKYISKEIFDFLVYDPKEELKKRGLHICGESADKVDIQMAFTCGVDYVLDLVDKMKPADVAPVVYAHWETDKHAALDFCSSCGEVVERYVTAGQMDRSNYKGETFWNYCPHCGARMDGKEGKE